MGEDKAYLSFKGTPFILNLIDLLKVSFHDLFLVGKDLDRYKGMGVPFARDRYSIQGAAVGIATALKAARHEWLFVCAVDMPLLNLSIVKLLNRHIPLTSALHVGVVPTFNERLEPLCAFYHRRFFDILDLELQKNRAPSLNALLCVHPTLKPAVPKELSKCLTNVNTPQEYMQLL